MADCKEASNLDPAAEAVSDNVDPIIAIRKQLALVDEQIKNERSAFCDMYVAAFLVDMKSAAQVAGRLEQEGSRSDDMPFLVAYSRKYRENRVKRDEIAAQCPAASAILAAFPSWMPSALPLHSTATLSDITKELQYQRKVIESLIEQLHIARMDSREIVYETTFPLKAHGQNFSISWKAVSVPIVKDTTSVQELRYETTVVVTATSLDKANLFFSDEFSRRPVGTAESSSRKITISAAPFRISDVTFRRYIEDAPPRVAGDYTVENGQQVYDRVVTTRTEHIVLERKETGLRLCCISLKKSRDEWTRKGATLPPKVKLSCWLDNPRTVASWSIADSWEVESNKTASG